MRHRTPRNLMPVITAWLRFVAVQEVGETSSADTINAMAKLPKPMAKQMAIARSGTDTPGWFTLVSMLFGFACVAFLIWNALQPQAPAATITTSPLSTQAPAPAPSSNPTSPLDTPTPTSSSAPSASTTPTSPTGPTRDVLTANGSTVALPEAAVVLAERALAASTDPAANNALPWMNPAYREPAIPAANPRWGKPFTLTTDGVAPYVFAATVYPDGANSSQSTQVIRTVIQDGTTWKLGPNQ